MSAAQIRIDEFAEDPAAEFSGADLVAFVDFGFTIVGNLRRATRRGRLISTPTAHRTIALSTADRTVTVPTAPGVDRG